MHLTPANAIVGEETVSVCQKVRISAWSNLVLSLLQRILTCLGLPDVEMAEPLA